jgi:pimeloyl-ACP methyl ester carboxylesterase
MSRIHQTALVGLLLLALFSAVGFSQVLLLHGWLGDGSNWNECIRIMTAAPYNFDPQRILSPSLPNDVSLVDWTVNIATYINSLPEDAKFTVVGHSFGGTSILFLLVVARHVDQGDLAQWAIGLSNQDPDLSPIIDALLSLADPNLFVRAARRVQKVFLYHPALGGGCYACSACGEIPIPLLCDDSLRDMCSLEMGKELIFEKDDVTALNIPVVGIYGTHAWCVGPCLGASDSDGSVSISGQRLFLSGDNYREVDGGAVCHADFIINLHHAAEDLVKMIFATKAGLATSR